MDTIDCDRASERILDAPPGVPMDPEVQGHLSACAACAELARLHGGAVAAFEKIELVAPDRVWQRVSSRLAPGDSVLLGLVEMVRAYLRPGLVLAGAAAMAVLLVVSLKGDRIGYQASGTIRQAGGLTLAAQGELVPGPGFLDLAEGARLTLRHTPGDSIVVEGPSRVRVADAASLQLESGLARFDLTPRKKSFVVRVPTGQVRVVGTTFTTQVNPDGTVVDLTRGRLEVRSSSGVARMIEAGQVVVVTAAGVENAPAPSPSALPSPSTSPSGSPLQTVSEPSSAPTPVPSAATAGSGVTTVRPGGKVQGGF